MLHTTRFHAVPVFVGWAWVDFLKSQSAQVTKQVCKVCVGRWMSQFAPMNELHTHTLIQVRKPVILFGIEPGCRLRPLQREIEIGWEFDGCNLMMLLIDSRQILMFGYTVARTRVWSSWWKCCINILWSFFFFLKLSLFKRRIKSAFVFWGITFHKTLKSS